MNSLNNPDELSLIHILALDPNEALRNEIEMIKNLRERTELERMIASFSGHMARRTIHLLDLTETPEQDIIGTGYSFDTLKKVIHIVQEESHREPL